MRQQLIAKITEIINNGWELIANDTHRWCSSDGFYEVQFTLRKGDNEIYLHTESGGQDLEDEWSDNNPQKINVNNMEYYLDEFDIEYILGIIDTYGT